MFTSHVRECFAWLQVYLVVLVARPGYDYKLYPTGEPGGATQCGAAPIKY